MLKQRSQGGSPGLEVSDINKYSKPIVFNEVKAAVEL